VSPAFQRKVVMDSMPSMPLPTLVFDCAAHADGDDHAQPQHPWRRHHDIAVYRARTTDARVALTSVTTLITL
jgi:hypothetical protein